MPEIVKEWCKKTRAMSLQPATLKALPVRFIGHAHLLCARLCQSGGELCYSLICSVPLRKMHKRHKPLLRRRSENGMRTNGLHHAGMMVKKHVWLDVKLLWGLLMGGDHGWLVLPRSHQSRPLDVHIWQRTPDIWIRRQQTGSAPNQ